MRTSIDRHHALGIGRDHIMCAAAAFQVGLTIMALTVDPSTPPHDEACPRGASVLLQVTNVETGSSLALFATDSAEGERVGHLPYDAQNLRMETCSVVPGQRYRWCRITNGTVTGWVDSYFLGRQKITTRASGDVLEEPRSCHASV